MGNCNEAREYDDETSDINSTNENDIKESQEEIEQINKFKQGTLVDPLYTHIRECIPENVIFSEDEKRFKKLYRIKNNLKSEKNFIYNLNVIEQKRTGQYFNAKIITKEKIQIIGEEIFRLMLKNELRALSLLNENSCEILLKIFLLKNKNSFKLILICNYTEPKSLLDIINEHITRKQKFSDKEIASIGKQLIFTLYRLKSLNIVHRNISPDNIFFIKSSNLKSLSLRNFYFSTQLGKTRSTSGVYGGLWYMSPEMIRDLKYDFKTDIWSVGIILYMMMTLENPFSYCDNRENMIDKLKTRKFFMSIKEIRSLGIDDDVSSFVYRMLVENPTIRPGSEILLDDEIFKNVNLIDNKITNKDIYNYLNYSDSFVEEFNIKTLKKESGILLHALNFYFIYNLRNLFIEDVELMRINEFFRLFDKNSNSFISFQELEDILKIKLNSNIKNRKIIDFNNKLIDNYKKLLSTILFVNDYVCKFHQLKNNSMNFENFVTANLILKIFKNKENDNIKKIVDILFVELDTNDNNEVEVFEIQDFIKSKKNNNFKEIGQLIQRLEEKEKNFKFDRLNRHKIQKILNYDIYKIDKQDEEKIKYLKIADKNDEKLFKKIINDIEIEEKKLKQEQNENIKANFNENEDENKDENNYENNDENNNENNDKKIDNDVDNEIIEQDEYYVNN
jgi:serine/threonine protein kinase